MPRTGYGDWSYSAVEILTDLRNLTGTEEKSVPVQFDLWLSLNFNLPIVKIHGYNGTIGSRHPKTE